MRALLIKKLTWFAGNQDIDSFHCTMFHGEANYLNSNGEISLHLIVNAFKRPKVFMPGSLFVVSENIAKDIKQDSAVKLRRVIVDKVVSIPYEEGSFDHFDNPAFEQGSEMPNLAMQNADGCNDLALTLPDFLEIVTVHSDDIPNEFSEGMDYQVDIGPTRFDEQFEAKLSIDTLRRYPIFQHPVGMVVSGRFLDLLEPLIDWRYFLKREIDVV